MLILDIRSARDDPGRMESLNSPSAIASGSRSSDTEPDGLMVFDGVCNFCSAQVRLLLKADRARAIRFTAIQSPYGRHLAARFGIDPDDPSTFLFFEHGQPLEKSDAVMALVRRLPAPWAWLGALRVLPRGVRDGLYGVIARNRYRILGRRNACMVPGKDVRERFVDEVPAGE